MRLGVITLGHVHAEELEPLTRHFEHLEQLVLDITPRAPLADHRAELNRAVDAATADWLLVVREREVVDEPLPIDSAEVTEAAKAWGFRPSRRERGSLRPLCLRNEPARREACDASVRSELSRRHSVAFAELLPEVVLGVEAAAARHLRHAQVAGLEQPRGLLEPLLLEEVAEETSGHAVEAAGDVLPRVAELARHGFDGHLFIVAQTAANRFY